MNKLYRCIDSIWGWISEKIFVRFQFDIPIEELRACAKNRTLNFCLTTGGLLDWLILSAWSRKNGLGPILVSNRKRVLCLSKPWFFIQIVLRQRQYADLIASEEPGPRLIFCPGGERRQPFTPTPAEKVISTLYEMENGSEFQFVPIHILWKKHSRGASRSLFEYLIGVGSHPNSFGKLWYLFRRRHDSAIKALEPLKFDSANLSEIKGKRIDSEPLRIAKALRRKVLVLTHQEMRLVLGPPYHAPYAVKETLIRDTEMQNLIEELAKEENQDKKKILMRAYRNLTEMVADYKFRTIEVFYVFLSWLFTKVFEGVDYREADLKELRETLKTKSVVYVPCHRSHLDYLVIPYVLFSHDIATPYIAAGINLSFWPLGPILRSAGAFFIRRSFRGDRLYSYSLKRYLEFLIKNRQTFKFFIEGTRSRSGKMLAPAYGLLKTTLEAHQRGISKEIAIIPVSIAYDKVLEEGSYTKELGGAKKEKESTTALLKSRRLINRRSGKVYLRFSKPILTEEIFSPENKGETDTKYLLQKTAFHISKAINDATPVTPKSITASVILGHRLSALPFEDIVRLSQLMGKYARWSKLELSAPDPDSFRRAVEHSLKALQKSNIIKVNEESTPRLYYCEEKKRALLNYYKNNGIHCFVVPSIFFLSFLRILSKGKLEAKEPFSKELNETALSLRDLLKFDFFFEPRGKFIDQIKDCGTYFLGNDQWTQFSVNESLQHLRSQIKSWDDFLIYPRLLGDLVVSYLTGLQVLKNNAPLKTDKKAFAQKCIRWAQSISAGGKMYFSESVSTQNYSNVLKLMENKGLLTLEKSNIEFRQWDSKAQGILEELESIHDVMEQNPKHFLERASRPQAAS